MCLLGLQCQRVLRYKPLIIGGARRDRTADLVNAIHALSQLSYGPLWSEPEIRSSEARTARAGLPASHLGAYPLTIKKNARPESLQEAVHFLAFGFRLAFLVLVAANDPRDVRLPFFLFFQKGVLIVSCRNLGSVIADVDDLLVLLDRNVARPLFGVFETDDLRPFEHGRLGLLLFDLPRLWLSAFTAARRRRRHLIDGLAYGTNDRRTIQVVKPRPTTRANALGSPCGFGH